MARLLLLTTEFGQGGAEQILFDLAVGLRDLGWTIHPAALDGEGAFRDRFCAAGFSPVGFGAPYPFRWRPGLGRKIRAYLQAHEILGVNSHLYHANLAARWACRSLNVPVLGTCHITESRTRPWRFWLDRWTATWAVGEICVSHAVARFQQAHTGLPESFYPVVPNGIEPSRVGAGPDRETVRHRLKIPSEMRLLGCVARLVPQKGLDLLIQALARPELRDTAPWRCVIAGDGPERARLEAQIIQADLAEHVHLLGPVETLGEIARGFDAFVLPSRWEGFGLTVLEATACDVPVIAFDLPPVREVLSPAGALWAHPADPAALAQTLRAALADPCRCEAALEVARTRLPLYTRDAMVKGYHEHLTAILDDRSAHPGVEAPASRA